MLREKIKDLGLRLKLGVLLLILFLVMILILIFALRGYVNQEFTDLSKTKGLFIANLLAGDLEPLVKENVDSQNVQRTVDTYKTDYGMYGVRYILIRDASGKIIIDTYKDQEVPEGIAALNPLSEKKQCQSFPSGGKTYLDCSVPLKFSADTDGSVRIGLLGQSVPSEVEQQLNAQYSSGVFRSILLLLIVLVLIVIALLTVVFQYFVIRRVVFLTEAAERMSFGDLETAISIKSQDEIGNLEDALERMRANLKDAIERLKRRK